MKGSRSNSNVKKPNQPNKKPHKKSSKPTQNPPGAKPSVLSQSPVWTPAHKAGAPKWFETPTCCCVSVAFVNHCLSPVLKWKPLRLQGPAANCHSPFSTITRKGHQAALSWCPAREPHGLMRGRRGAANPVARAPAHLTGLPSAVSCSPPFPPHASLPP